MPIGHNAATAGELQLHLTGRIRAIHPAVECPGREMKQSLTCVPVELRPRRWPTRNPNLLVTRIRLPSGFGRFVRGNDFPNKPVTNHILPCQMDYGNPTD